MTESGGWRKCRTSPQYFLKPSRIKMNVRILAHDRIPCRKTYLGLFLDPNKTGEAVVLMKVMQDFAIVLLKKFFSFWQIKKFFLTTDKKLFWVEKIIDWMRRAGWCADESDAELVQRRTVRRRGGQPGQRSRQDAAVCPFPISIFNLFSHFRTWWNFFFIGSKIDNSTNMDDLGKEVAKRR